MFCCRSYSLEQYFAQVFFLGWGMKLMLALYSFHVVNESEGKVSDLYNFQDLQIGYLQTDNSGEKKQLGRSLCNLDELVMHQLHQENHYNHQNSVKLWDEQLILSLIHI